jgi:CRISPR/Cas system type I-B associated protein Csh2 (Cas7 group RAMP superfamily)
MSKEYDDRRWILVEKMASDMETIKENVSQIPDISERLGRVEDRLDGVEGQLAVHGQILKEHSADLKEIKTIVVQRSENITELKIDVKEIKDAVVGVQATSHTHA